MDEGWTAAALTCLRRRRGGSRTSPSLWLSGSVGSRAGKRGEARFGLQSRTRLSLGSGLEGQPAVWKGGAESHTHIPAVVLGAVSCRGEFRMPEAGVATDTGQGPG